MGGPDHPRKGIGMRITFKGRTAGSIGIFYPITIEVPNDSDWIGAAHLHGFEVYHLISVERG